MTKKTANSRNNRQTKKIGVAAQGSTMDGGLVDHWDLAAFEESLGRCEAKVYRLAVQLACCESAAREVVQETFHAAWQNMHNFVSRSQIETWVYRKAVKTALGRFDCAKVSRQYPEDHCLLFMMTAQRFCTRAKSDGGLEWLGESRPSPRQTARIYQRVRKIVDALPIGLRAVFILGVLEETPVEELAEILGSPSDEVKENLQLARATVLDALGHHCACAARRAEPCSIAPETARETADVRSSADT